MRAISLKAKKACRHSTRRSGRALFQALEQRQLLSLVGVTLNNPPVLAFADNSQGSVSYSASTHDFSLSGGLNTSSPSGLLSLPGSVSIDIKVDNTGSLIAGTATSSDITVTDQTGTLLTGKAEAFGYLYQDASDAEFDFQFQVTGGSMAPQFSGQDIGVLAFADFSNFTNTFTTNFTTNNKSYLGPVTPTQVTPNIITNTGPAVVIGSGNQLTDSATLSNGNNPTGTITFDLYGPGDSTYSSPIFEQAVTVNGNGIYSLSSGYTPTSTGTYEWIATYSGDSKNSSVASGQGDEPETVNSASPSINTSQQPATAVVGGTIADQATVTGGYNPTGTVTFNLYDNASASGTPLFTDTEALVGGVATSSGYTTTTTGTDYWVATYNGDTNNNAATSGLGDEPVVNGPASPSINTSQQPATATVGATIADQATVTGGYNPTGTVTFNLYDNASASGTPLFTDTEALVGGVATSSGYTTTTAGTDYWVATYNGDTNNNAVTSGFSDEPVVNGPAGPSITTTPGGTITPGSMSISGSKFNDLTGNGFSSDDTAQGGITINLYEESGSNSGLQTGSDNLIATTTTGTDGSYSFPISAAGTYYVQEALPSGYVQTGGGPNGNAGNSYFTINATSGNSYAGANFDDFKIPTCQPTCITYKVTHNGKTCTYSSLDGHTHPGDKVQVCFTVPSGMNDTLTLVSYSTPSSSWNTSTAHQQLIYDVDTQTFAPGKHCLTVTIPCSYYQIDFVCGNAIDQFVPSQNSNAYGPDSGMITYHNEGRFIDSDSGGSSVGSLNTQSPSIPTITVTSTSSSQTLTDSATLSGGFNPTGTITFYLFAPGTTPLSDFSNNIYSNTVTVNGDGVYDTSTGTNPGGYVPTGAGTYNWVAVYSGDTNNNGVAGNFGDEKQTVGKAGSPTITTDANFTKNCFSTTNIVGSAVMEDVVTVSGGVNPTGSVVFSLTAPDGTTSVAGTVAINGDGSYTSPTVLATEVGTYTWSATYSGDNLNAGATDNGANESLTTVQAAPCISTTPGTSSTSMVSPGQFATIGFWHNKNGQAVINSFNSGSNDTDLGNWMASTFPNLFGASNPYTGTSLAGLTNAQVADVYSSMWTPSGVTKNTYVQAFAVALGLYADNTSLGFNSTAAGFGFVGTAGGAGSYNIGSNGSAFGVADNTDMTVLQALQTVGSNFDPSTGLFYGGDSSNTSAANNVLNGINTTGDIGGSGTIATGATIFTDSATLSGGYNPTGTITFQLYAPDGTTVVYTDVVTVNGDGKYDTSTGTNPGGFVPTDAGTYQWVATYSGDVNNVTVAGKMGDEPAIFGSSSCQNTNPCDNNNNNNSWCDNNNDNNNNWCDNNNNDNNNNSCNNNNNDNNSWCDNNNDNNNNWCNSNNSNNNNQNCNNNSNNNDNDHDNNNWCNNNNSNNNSNNNNNWCNNNNSNNNNNDNWCNNNNNNNNNNDNNKNWCNNSNSNNNNGGWQSSNSNCYSNSNNYCSNGYSSKSWNNSGGYHCS